VPRKVEARVPHKVEARARRRGEARVRRRGEARVRRRVEARRKLEARLPPKGGPGGALVPTRGGARTGPPPRVCRQTPSRGGACVLKPAKTASCTTHVTRETGACAAARGWSDSGTGELEAADALARQLPTPHPQARSLQ